MASGRFSDAGAVKQLAQVRLSGTQATIYTPPAPPANLVVKVWTIFVANNDSAAKKVYLFKGSGSLTEANAILPGKSVGGNDYILMSGSGGPLMVIPQGYKLDAYAETADKVVITIDGEEVTD